jgi:hypothetical protein
VTVGQVLGRLTRGRGGIRPGESCEQVVPLAALGAAVVAAIVLANAIAFVPGRLAARIQPSAALRAE